MLGRRECAKEKRLECKCKTLCVIGSLGRSGGAKGWLPWRELKRREAIWQGFQERREGKGELRWRGFVQEKAK